MTRISLLSWPQELKRLEHRKLVHSESFLGPEYLNEPQLLHHPSHTLCSSEEGLLVLHQPGASVSGNGQEGLLSDGPHVMELPTLDVRLAPARLAFRKMVKPELVRQAFN